MSETATPERLTLTSVDARITRQSAELDKYLDIVDRGRGSDSLVVRQAVQHVEFLHGYLAALRHVRYAMTHDDGQLS